MKGGGVMCESKDFKSNIYVNKKAAQKDFMELYYVLKWSFNAIQRAYDHYPLAYDNSKVARDLDTIQYALADARKTILFRQSPLFKKGGDAQCRIAKKKKG
jgi:hypothetical protein